MGLLQQRVGFWCLCLLWLWVWLWRSFDCSSMGCMACMDVASLLIVWWFHCRRRTCPMHGSNLWWWLYLGPGRLVSSWFSLKAVKFTSSFLRFTFTNVSWFILTWHVITWVVCFWLFVLATFIVTISKDLMCMCGFIRRFVLFGVGFRSSFLLRGLMNVWVGGLFLFKIWNFWNVL